MSPYQVLFTTSLVLCIIDLLLATPILFYVLIRVFFYKENLKLHFWKADK
jgi:hypothetical protein